ncbi:MAG: hypothetical protein AAGA48_24830 [Myxococcota bacterium]
MSDALEMWSDRMGKAQSVEDQRALLADLAVWRARHLSDVVATRRATYTIARLHQRLGNQSQALAEAQSLASLFRTPPKPTDEATASATALFTSLGQAVPEMSQTGARRGRNRDRDRERPERRRDRENPKRERPAKNNNSNQKNGVQDAKRAAQDGDFGKVLKELEGARGPSAAVLRAYAELSTLLQGETIEKGSLESIRQELGRAAGLRHSAPPSGDDPLSKLVGQPVPTRRPARIRVLEQFAEAHPDRVDELADVALRQHVVASGKDAPAPWLVGFVGRALATSEGSRTRAAIGDLRQQSAFAVKAYDEWPFERLLRVMKHAIAEGFKLGPLRRGVLAREEPDDRKLWTLRLTGPDGIERMIAVGPHATNAYVGNLSETLAARLVSLSPRTLFLGTGFGNEALRKAVEAQGLGTLEHDTDDAAILTATLAVEGPKRAEGAGQTPPAQLVAALTAEPFEADAVGEAVQRFRRPDRALRSVVKLDLDDERTAALLAAVHEAVPADQVIPEGTTLAVRTAATGPKTLALIESGPAAARFGGPNITQVVEVTRTALSDGWILHRVLQGPTRREIRNHPPVQPLASSLDGLWRLLVRRGDQRGELWYVAVLPPEGRGAIPMLLLEQHERAVVLAADEELVNWWGTLSSAPAGIAWSPEAADAVKSALNGFAAEAPRTDNGAPAAEAPASETPETPAPEAPAPETPETPAPETPEASAPEVPSAPEEPPTPDANA